MSAIILSNDRVDDFNADISLSLKLPRNAGRAPLTPRILCTNSQSLTGTLSISCGEIGSKLQSSNVNGSPIQLHEKKAHPVRPSLPSTIVANNKSQRRSSGTPWPSASSCSRRQSSGRSAAEAIAPHAARHGHRGRACRDQHCLCRNDGCAALTAEARATTLHDQASVLVHGDPTILYYGWRSCFFSIPPLPIKRTRPPLGRERGGHAISCKILLR